MKILIVEDDFISRKLMKSLFSAYGDCDIAVNGQEAVEMFKLSIDEGAPYALICLDIMMPEMDGHEALKKIREYEALSGRDGEEGVKVIMTTALGDFDNIKTAFKEQCEAYLVKPIEIKKIEDVLRKLELVS